MKIYKSIDIEEEIRTALSPYLTAYCRPLPAEYSLPNILITQVGGTQEGHVDTFDVVIDSRAAVEAEALDANNTAIAVLIQTAKEQTTVFRRSRASRARKASRRRITDATDRELLTRARLKY